MMVTILETFTCLGMSIGPTCRVSGQPYQVASYSIRTNSCWNFIMLKILEPNPNPSVFGLACQPNKLKIYFYMYNL